MKKALIACEFSGAVRSRLRKMGVDAWSCDLLAADDSSRFHFQQDISDVLTFEKWDLVIAFPPCTFLAASGSRWFYHPDDKGLPVSERRVHPLYPNRKQDRQKAVDFFMQFANCSAPRVAIENPVGCMSRLYRKPDQIVHPYHFGQNASKQTCLWLKGLPLLQHTNVVDRGEMHTTKGGKTLPKWYNLPPSEERAKIRSTTFSGIADAMAAQWGLLLLEEGKNEK